MLPEDTLRLLAQKLAKQLQDNQQMLVTAESCTGGWLAKIVTDLPGSSNWYDSGFVTYSNHAKQQALGVSAELIAEHGAVSQAVVEAMVSGALKNSQAEVAAAVSGIAGPGGGSESKPVGTVCLAVGLRDQPPVARQEHFSGDREAIRYAAIKVLLQELLRLTAKKSA
ncbi:nicotinamide-nucleotide amidase [Ectothiorhodosinus mongolicus]|uniref:Nicotinamide-nucleotide amidase n=1 Tax=Ectothiorhodosinus mongolicus TaxID=233100 RepID=A0A1R3VMM8_9GAMM|nr:CinA family protein [Ectothiorhodosinus mongolicus]ULX56328.1 CinA family protein [Ectothiorhodosinus mongolicus]SIT65840.1 nicotinamide-nucleotide amidase [Ectothiorhodosinus mongolicus]